MFSDCLGSTPAFFRTRIPILISMGHLEADDRLDEFLESYPMVSQGQAIELLERAKAIRTGNLGEAAT